MIIKITGICLLSMLFLCVGSSCLQAEDDIAAQRSCSHCGMDRKAYGYSRMVVSYDDGTSVGVCSLHCAVIELKTTGERKVKTLLTADRDTRTMIDATKAVWVIGGRKKGVMTQRPKWAFATQAGAEAFIADHGGTLTDWQTAFTAAKEDAATQFRQ